MKKKLTKKQLKEKEEKKNKWTKDFLVGLGSFAGVIGISELFGGGK
jgi:hypothetical protein